MYDEQYTYAVARIRARETTLFSQAPIDQLMACRGNFDPGEGENLGIDAGTGRRHVGV